LRLAEKPVSITALGVEIRVSGIDAEPIGKMNEGLPERAILRSLTTAAKVLFGFIRFHVVHDERIG
jgi:hypothetical protein